MGKVILTESQYRRLKKKLIESAIINESAYELDEKKFTLKTNEVIGVGYGLNYKKIVTGSVFKPTESKNLVSVTEVTNPEGGNPKKMNVYYMCNKGTFNELGEPTANFRNQKPGFDKLCGLIKSYKKQAITQSVTGSQYIVQNNYILTSDNSGNITIPKGTSFVKKEGQTGWGFYLPKVTGNINGWYDCKSKKFQINKIFYTDSSSGLSSKLDKNGCITITSKEIIQPSGTGGSSYTQQNDRIIVASDGKTLKIPKGTAYVSKPEKNGLSFNLGGSKFGWFGCKSKTFIVDNVTYTDKDSVLANILVAKSCGTKETETKTSDTNTTVSGGGGGNSGSEDQTPFNGEFIDFV